MMRSLVTLALVTALAGPAAAQESVPAQQNAPHKHAAAHAQHGGQLHMISMDVDFKPHKRPEQGRLSGYDPIVTVVHVGDRIRFSNTDDNQHTATGYAFGGQTIPENYRFQGDPSVAHGDTINASEWSTGTLRPHSVDSKVFKVTTPGTFYYADAYNQKIMRGAIVVKQ